jgi:RHS repeat-associated protein
MATVTDSTSSLKGNYTYDAWGRVLNPVDPLGNKNAFKFTGEMLDSTGLYYLRSRYYDPTVGQFISKDQLSGRAYAPVTTNRYAYGRGNPLRFSDPTGLSAEPVVFGSASRASYYYPDFPYDLAPQSPWPQNPDPNAPTDADLAFQQIVNAYGYAFGDLAIGGSALALGGGILGASPIMGGGIIDAGPAVASLLDAYVAPGTVTFLSDFVGQFAVTGPPLGEITPGVAVAGVASLMKNAVDGEYGTFTVPSLLLDTSGDFTVNTSIGTFSGGGPW